MFLFRIIAIFLAVCFVLWMVVGFVFAKMIVKPRVRNLSETEKEENKRDGSLVQFFNEHLTKTYAIRSPFGYDIRVYALIKNPNSKRFVVVSHGHTYSHHGSIKFAKMMMRLGYNAILYDQRYHGHSGGKNSSLGFYEKDDLKTLIDHLEETYGKDLFIGTCGESMGSATCLLEQKEDKRVKFVISDAGFMRLDMLIKEQMAKKHLPSWLFLGLTDFFVKHLAGFSLKQVSPIDALKNAHIPILFVHGKQDQFIPYKHAVEMYQSYKGKKRLYIANGKAFHARSYYHHQERYFKEVESFMKECVETSVYH